MSTQEKSQSENKTTTRPNRRGPREVSHPNDVASLVMLQVDNVNAKKDELTIAIKALSDTTKQLVRAYGEHVTIIQKLQERVKALEEKNGR